MKSEDKEIEIYHGTRGPPFKELILTILKKGKLKQHYLDLLTDSKSIQMYDKAFTHKTADPDNNYEFLELLGDSTLNDCIVWYLSRRFPQLNCAAGVKVVARLKINLVSKKQFAELGQSLGLWPFVSADVQIRETKMKPTLEDAFEAFIGATRKLLDSRIRLGTGHAICYDIIASLFDQVSISLKYEDLFDPKTRLKELFDYYGSKLGQLKYESERKIDEGTGYGITNVTAYILTSDRKKICIGEGSGSLKTIATQAAAESALEHLKKQGYERPIPEDYKMFCKY